MGDLSTPNSVQKLQTALHAKDRVKSCPRAGCGKSACPVVCPAKAGMFSRRKACRGKSQGPRSLDSRVAGNQDFSCHARGRDLIWHDRFTSIRDVASNVSNAQGAVTRRAPGERVKSTQKHAFKMGALNGRKRRETERRRYGQDAPNAGFPRLHTERASSTLFRLSGEHEDGTEARDRFGSIVAADAKSIPPSALHLDRVC